MLAWLGRASNTRRCLCLCPSQFQLQIPELNYMWLTTLQMKLSCLSISLTCAKSFSVVVPAPRHHRVCGCWRVRPHDPQRAVASCVVWANQFPPTQSTNGQDPLHMNAKGPTSRDPYTANL